MNEPVASAPVASAPTAKQGDAAPVAAFDMDTLIGYILLAGVLSSMALLVTGMLWHGLSAGTLHLEYALGGTNLWEFLLGTFRNIAAGSFHPQAVINLGISVLLLTPYVRVLASMLYFSAVERNWKYSAFTLFVFSVLTYSLFLR